jgi:hypothetical protein
MVILVRSVESWWARKIDKRIRYVIHDSWARRNTWKHATSKHIVARSEICIQGAAGLFVHHITLRFEPRPLAVTSPSANALGLQKKAKHLSVVLPSGTGHVANANISGRVLSLLFASSGSRHSGPLDRHSAFFL